MVLAEPIRIILRIAEAFERLSIRYLLGGSLASSLHGIPRATHDADLVADIAEEHIPSLVETLSSEFYIDDKMARDAVIRRRSFNVIHLATMFKVDIFILKPDPASQREMDRRERYSISDSSDETLFLATAEDIIVHKLCWFKKSGGASRRQWDDVIGVLQVQDGRLDMKYLASAARQRDVFDLLEQGIEETAGGLGKNT